MFDGERDDRLDEVRRLTAIGRTAQQIAEQIGCSKRQVCRDRRSLGLSPPHAPPLTDSQLEQAEALLDDGASRSETARTLGVAETTIRRHFPGRGWTKQQIAEHSAFLNGRRYRRR